jgi:D-alanine-D-alanine ligase
MHIAFLYNRSADDPAHAAEDEFLARSPVVAALKRLGHTVTPIACTLDLAKVRQRLVRVKPDVVFNRVESLGGSDGMMAAITLLLDSMQIPYTGNSTAALVATASKVSVKERLVEAGLPTPAWISNGVRDDPARCAPIFDINGQKFIIKSVFEHASFEIDDASIVGPAPEEQIRELVRDREAQSGRSHFAEAFIEGREFNISVMGEPPLVLPPAEIDFSLFPSDKPHIVGHIAKWDETSFEYNSTERLFEFSASDASLLRELTDLTTECWRLFGLTGYARVDFRCDAEGRPWILEVNTNPCIMPEAGFATALEYARIGYDNGLQRILDDAVARGTTRPAIRENLAAIDV